MKKILYVALFVALGLLHYNCEEAPSLVDPPADYVTFESEATTALVQLNGTGSLDINVYSTTIANSSRSFSVSVDESSSASAASYTVPSSVDIPAGSNQGVISLSFVDGEISNAGETLVLNLGTQDGTSVGSPITINVLRDCPSNLEGDYVYTNGNQKSVTIVKTGATSYTVSGDAAFTTDYPFNFTDTCNEITITGGAIADNFGLAVSGNGSVDADTGVITFYYTVEGNLDNFEMILERQ